MFRELRVAVVIPAFNEELNVARTVRDVPGFVDHVLVVDDASHDRTFREASRLRRRGLEVLRHPRNRGVGAAIATGYRRALELGVDVAVVMAGDGQMDPARSAGAARADRRRRAPTTSRATASRTATCGA